MAYAVSTAQVCISKQQITKQHMKQCDPRHTHKNSAKYSIPRLDDLVGRKHGLFIEPAVIDEGVGEEIVLFLRDNQATIDKLVKIHCSRLQLMISAGCENNLFGSVAFVVFWIIDLNDESETPIVSTIKFFNPHSEPELLKWRRLADVNHWHLFLVVGNKWIKMIDYINESDKFELNKKLDMIVERQTGVPTRDFIKAKELFMQEYTVEELVNMPEGRFGRFYAFSKSDLVKLLNRFES